METAEENPLLEVPRPPAEPGNRASCVPPFYSSPGPPGFQTEPVRESMRLDSSPTLVCPGLEYRLRKVDEIPQALGNTLGPFGQESG